MADSNTRIVVAGAKGRMGQTLLDCAKRDPQIDVVGGFDVGEAVDDFLQKGAVLVDFTMHTATPDLARAAQKSGCPMVIGTTGHSDAERTLVASASKKVPIVMSPNMSVGVNLLFSLTGTISSTLRDGFDVEIIEKHHRHKKDAPSGTAVRLLEIVSKVKGRNAAKVARHGRQGDLEARTAEEIGLHSIRGGDFVGEHTVIFAGDGETLEITHKASSREIFARGALLAAKWAGRASPGLYDLFDVLGLRNSQKAS